MRKSMRRSAAAAMLSVATLALSACGSSSGGTETTGQASPNPATSKSSEPSGPPLAGVKPCDVLMPEQASKLGLNGPGTINEFNDAACDWKIERLHTLSVATYKDMALNEINFSDAQREQTILKGHEALLARENTGKGTCSMAFAVTKSSSVSVNSVADTTQEACATVKKAAPMVEATVFGS